MSELHAVSHFSCGVPNVWLCDPHRARGAGNQFGGARLSNPRAALNGSTKKIRHRKTIAIIGTITGSVIMAVKTCFQSNLGGGLIFPSHVASELPRVRDGRAAEKYPVGVTYQRTNATRQLLESAAKELQRTALHIAWCKYRNEAGRTNENFVIVAVWESREGPSGAATSLEP